VAGRERGSGGEREREWGREGGKGEREEREVEREGECCKAILYVKQENSIVW